MPLLTNNNGLLLWQSSTANLHELRADANALAQQYCSTPIEHSPSGAPLLKNSDRFISISHTANYLALLTSDNPCGIDIELLSRDASRVARKFTTPQEVDTARAAFAHNPELLIWCAKEALYKRCLREGASLTDDFKILKVDTTQLYTTAFGEDITLKYSVLESENLLIVTT